MLRSLVLSHSSPLDIQTADVDIVRRIVLFRCIALKVKLKLKKIHFFPSFSPSLCLKTKVNCIKALSVVTGAATSKSTFFLP